MSLRDKFKIIDANDFPKWIEDEALGVLEWHARLFQLNADRKLIDSARVSNKSEYIENIERNYSSYFSCFQSSELEYCWHKVKELDEIDGYKGQVWLAHMLWNSFPHPSSCRMTKRDAEEWKLKLSKSLGTIRELINGMPENMYSWDYIGSIRESLKDANYVEEQCLVIDKMIMPNPVEVIDSYLNSLNLAEYDPVYSGKHVNSKTSVRVYFMRSLTAGLMSKFGTPNRKFVVKLVSVAFDCEISQQEIIRGTKNIKPFNNERGISDKGNEYFSKYLDQLLD